MKKYKPRVWVQAAAQQVNGREGETATLLSRCVVLSACVFAVSPYVNFDVELL